MKIDESSFNQSRQLRNHPIVHRRRLLSPGSESYLRCMYNYSRKYPDRLYWFVENLREKTK